MAYQIVAVNDAAPGACVDVGLTWNGSTTLTATQIIAGTACTMSGTMAITGNTTIGGSLMLTSNLSINTNKFLVAASTGNTIVAGTLTATGAQTLTGATTHAAAVAFGAAENAATHGAVAIPITKLYQGYTTDATSAIAATLADGAVGQMIMIKLTAKDTNNMVITPANLTGGTTITFDATGEVAILVFVGTAWVVMHTTATVA